MWYSRKTWIWRQRIWIQIAYEILSFHIYQVKMTIKYSPNTKYRVPWAKEVSAWPLEARPIISSVIQHFQSKPVISCPVPTEKEISLQTEEWGHLTLGEAHIPLPLISQFFRTASLQDHQSGIFQELCQSLKSKQLLVTGSPFTADVIERPPLGC